MLDVSAIIAANRFGLGARPEEAGDVARDPQAWVRNQIYAPYVPPPLLADLPDAAEYTRQFLEARQQGGDGGVAEFLQRRIRQETLAAEIGARVQVAVQTREPFRERLVQFWSNHFTVSVQRPVVAPIAGAYERDAIRPHVFGRFADLLIAATRHQAMLFYLDNIGSVGPNSRAGQLGRRGINENHAREILELHTLGVGGGYTQNDVRELAKILTGWTVVTPPLARRSGLPESAVGMTRFAADAHEPGNKSLVGHTFNEGGESEGIAALQFLATHPATARHVATKLARHFVADDPPSAAVARLEKVYLETRGDLAAVSFAIVDLPEIWERPNTKVRAPGDLVIAAYRALDVKVTAGQLPGTMREMGQPVFAAPSPAGWPDRASDWVGPEAMLRRAEWAVAVSRRVRSPQSPEVLAGYAIGAVAPPAVRRAIAEADPAEGVALLLACAEFQRR